ncbi:hypothetical protein [Rhodococcus globerulus]|uniref:hypothetical protein n=1 Tax=Rhodococcus globerulus TaxID=33008 RepID=UPI001F3CE1F0|nr:hypothetical protein [Rhodococcus globerulus]
MTSVVADLGTGIIRELVDVVVPRRFPPKFKLIRSCVVDSVRFSERSGDSVGAGYSFDLGDPGRPLQRSAKSWSVIAATSSVTDYPYGR